MGRSDGDVDRMIYAEDYDDAEDWARAYIQDMIDQGHAVAMANAFSDHSQSCAYLESILIGVANAEFGTVSGDVRNFARNLLDDWSK